MDGTNKKEFAMALGVLGIATGKEVDGPLVDIYWQFLRDLPLEDFKRALTEAGKTLKWFAKPSELRELAEGPKRITAAMQWAHVRAVMDAQDIYFSPDFGPLVNAVLHALGGWKELCEKTITQLTWYQKDFERLYDDFSTKDLSRMRTHGHIGEFGKPPEWCAIEGTVKPAPQLTSGPANGVSNAVRALADSKSLGKQEREAAKGSA